MLTICTNFFAKLVQSISLSLSKSDNGKWVKQRFSLLQEKAVIQAVCLRTQAVSKKPGFRPNGRAIGIKEKSENFNSLSQYFLSYWKKNYREGSI